MIMTKHNLLSTQYISQVAQTTINEHCQQVFEFCPLVNARQTTSVQIFHRSYHILQQSRTVACLCLQDKAGNHNKSPLIQKASV